MIRGILKRVSSNHDNLRTGSIEGVAFSLPTIGARFWLFAEGLQDPSADRVVNTTEVIDVSGERFWTANSTYEFEVLL